MHGNARLTPLVRAEIAHQVLIKGETIRAVATARMVSPRTVRRWVNRAREDGLGERLYERSCVPIHQPKRTTAVLETQVLKLRRERRTYAQILMVVPISKATLSRILRRHGLNRLSSLDPLPKPVVRYEHASPGDLIHLDIKKLGRFHKPGVRATGNRADRNAGAGTEALHVAIDDHSRLGFACILPNEKRPSVIDALHQAHAYYRFHGITPKAVLTDNGSAYRSKAFKQACADLGLKHRFTRPYRPQTNGKAERFIQTLCREWALTICYQSSHERAAYLPHYLFDYNHHRPHSALKQMPPISRAPLCGTNVSRHDS